jgi:hypothetical protein
VTKGRVAVHRDGKVRVHLGPGDSFGERGLLDNAPRNATVTTEVESILLLVEGHALLEALEAAPTLRPSLDLSSTAPGVQVRAGETLLVDDPALDEGVDHDVCGTPAWVLAPAVMVARPWGAARPG